MGPDVTVACVVPLSCNAHLRCNPLLPLELHSGLPRCLRAIAFVAASRRLIAIDNSCERASAVSPRPIISTNSARFRWSSLSSDSTTSAWALISGKRRSNLFTSSTVSLASMRSGKDFVAVLNFFHRSL